MTKHYRLSPSSAYRWRRCHGSAIENPPDSGGEEASEGTYMHDAAACALTGRDLPELTDEQTRHIFTYVNYVREHASGMDNAQMIIEETTESKVLPKIFGGTPDCLLVSDTELHVIDFKYGMKKVKTVGNDQLMSYLTLANEKFPGRKTFYGSIVQPRVPGSPIAEKFDPRDLQNFAIDTLEAAFSNRRVAGSHCQYCPVLQTLEGCETNFRYLSEQAGVVFEEKGWNLEKCNLVLQIEEMIKPLVSLAKKEIRGMLLRGEAIEGWRLAKSLGNRKFLDKGVVVEELLKLGFGSEDIFEERLKSPAQLEKISGLAKKVVDTYAHRDDNGVIAVTEDSRLPIFEPENFDFPTLPE